MTDIRPRHIGTETSRMNRIVCSNRFLSWSIAFMLKRLAMRGIVTILRDVTTVTAICSIFCANS